MRYADLLATVYRRLAEEWGKPAAWDECVAYGESVKTWPAFPDSADALRYLKRHFRLVILSNVDNVTTFPPPMKNWTSNSTPSSRRRTSAPTSPQSETSTTCSETSRERASPRRTFCTWPKACTMTTRRRTSWVSEIAGFTADAARRDLEQRSCRKPCRVTISFSAACRNWRRRMRENAQTEVLPTAYEQKVFNVAWGWGIPPECVTQRSSSRR